MIPCIVILISGGAAAAVAAHRDARAIRLRHAAGGAILLGLALLGLAFPMAI